MIGHPVSLSLEGRAISVPLDAEVLVDGVPAYLTSAGDSVVTFSVPSVGPGPANVEVRPDSTTGWVQLDSLEVSKAILPLDGVAAVGGEVRLRLAPGVSQAEVAIDGDVFSRAIPEGADDPLLSRWWRVEFTGSSVEQRIAAYAAIDGVEVAEFAQVYAPARTTNDTFRSDQYNVDLTRLTAMWEVRTAAAADVEIAILDTGVRHTHEDLTVIERRDFTGTGLAPCDDHGTHVAGIAGARGNNARGIAGAAWGGEIGSFKVLGIGAGCTGTDAALLNGITAAVNSGYEIVNMSLGYDPNEPPPQNTLALQDAINVGWGGGVFFVAAAGNDNTNLITFPGAYDNVFSVANTTATDQRNATSNFGAWVDLAAPGTAITSSVNTSDSGYAVFTGTSMAAPLVAGTAALLRSHGHNNAAIRDRLLANGDLRDWDPTRTGERRLNAYRALDPGRGCIRDIPDGAWIRNDANTVYVVDGTSKRPVADLTVLASWKVDGTVRLCPNRINEVATSSTGWGYKPGQLVRAPDGSVYLIGTTGVKGAAPKRHITSRAVATCFGWNVDTMPITGTTAALNAHPTGPPISICNSLLPRTAIDGQAFPDGSLVGVASGGRYVVDGGRARHIPDPTVLGMWYTFSDFVPITDAEKTAMGLESDKWGMRPGARVQQSGQAAQYMITGTPPAGSLVVYANGLRRHIADAVTLSERGLSAVALTSVSATSIGLHAVGATLLNADDMP